MEVRIFCPATIANLNCGFDVMGLCLENIGDEMIFRKITTKGIQITNITGADLPYEVSKNVAGVAALAVIENRDIDFGIAIEIHKKIKAGSGIGSSSASAAGAAFGVNELIGRPFSKKELIHFAMKGEALASGSEHADNVAPCLLGGFTLVRGYNPLDVIKITSPEKIYAVVLHPHIEVKTADARAVLEPTIPFQKAITQWGNLGGLIAGLYTEDYSLIGRSLQDVVVEPFRKHLIPHFDKVKEIVLQEGALGCGISGAGPSIFAICEGKQIAETVAVAMKNEYSKTKITFDVYLSRVNDKGVTLL
ncbi:homoserine kinase [Flavobacterium sp. J27]|uniref:homoserine kinase n=1 Tax=Flavobacterium sp. J27 TaxID=2060419 RepID=UPI00102F9898|nr:homoserine kinase [Flavobacterium sp. J27]